jgi:VWFA-related protein
MKLVSRHLRSSQRVFTALLLTVLTLCISPCLGPARHGIALFRGAIAAAQSHVPVIHVEVDLQPIDVQVEDKNGNNIPGLTAKDFAIFENGQRQKIAFFDSGNSPVSIAIVVDSSSTMSSNGPVGSAQAVAAQFMRTARPGDQIFAMNFTDQMGPFEQLAPEQLLNPSGVTLAPAPSSGSALYDAIADALCHLRTSKNLRQAMIVVSDGVD